MTFPSPWSHLSGALEGGYRVLNWQLVDLRPSGSSILSAIFVGRARTYLPRRSLDYHKRRERAAELPYQTQRPHLPTVLARCATGSGLY